MGDVRFDKPYETLKDALRPAEVLRSMSSEDVIAALAAASRQNDPLLANVLATEAQNRVSRQAKAMEDLAYGVCVVEARGTVAYINHAATQILQREPADVIGTSFKEVIPLKDPTIPSDPADGPIGQVLAQGRSIESEQGVLALPRWAEPILVAYSAVPMKRDDVIMGVVVGFRDITARRRAEEALVQSEARHRLLLDALPDAILVTDQDGFVRYANPAACELFGRDARELVGTNLGIPTLDARGVVVDVSTVGGSWGLARLRTVLSTWEGYVSIYSQIPPAKTAR